MTGHLTLRQKNTSCTVGQGEAMLSLCSCLHSCPQDNRAHVVHLRACTGCLPNCEWACAELVPLSTPAAAAHHILRRCKADDQVFLCYGRHSNLQLLIHYGFVLSTNTHDTALLPTHLLPAEVLERLDSTGGGRHSSTTTTTTANVCYVRPGGEPSFELLRALRLAGATAEERRSRAYLALADQPISWSSEQAALGTLRQACRQALEALPTTAEEDAQLLAGGRAEHQELSDCGWVAVEWRLGYKQALQAAVALADRALAVLEGPQHAVPWPQAAANCIAGLVRRPRLLD